MGRPKGSKNKSKPAPEVEPNQKPAEHPVDESDLGEPHHVERLSAIEEIAQQNREERDAAQDDMVVANEETGDLETITKDEETEETTEEETTEETVEATTEEPEKRKFTIDGEERELTDDEITAIVQKSGAVDSRLKEATELLQDAKRTTQQTPATEAQPPVSTSSDTDAGAGDEQLAKDLTDAIVYGEEEQVAEAIGKLLGNGRMSQDIATQTQGMTPEQVQGYVVETIAFNEGKRLLDLPPDKGGYSDLWSDPVLKAEFQRRENELRDANDSRSYIELYTFIGDEVRTWRDQLIKQHTPKTGLEDRTDAKRKTGVVRGAGAKTTIVEESKPLTHDEKLAQMAAARGQ